MQHSFMSHTSYREGFTLVELSIVLVILGLLVGGVLTGQTLIRASELRAVSSEYQRYVTAVQAFRDKYFAIPGDMTNATSFWGADPNGCPATANTTLKKETCNGDGDGTLNGDYEGYRIWQQLANAGLIEGTYSGVSSSGSTWTSTPRVNAPASKLSGGIWTARYLLVPGVDTERFTGTLPNHFQFGARLTWNDNPILSPEEAWNIDTKIDDGQPATGTLMAMRSCTNAVSKTDYAASYLLSNPSKLCYLHFLWGGNFIR